MHDGLEQRRRTQNNNYISCSLISNTTFIHVVTQCHVICTCSTVKSNYEWKASLFGSQFWTGSARISDDLSNPIRWPDSWSLRREKRTGITWIPQRISNDIHYKVWDEIIYPFPNCIVEVWVCACLSILEFNLIYGSKKGPLRTVSAWLLLTFIRSPSMSCNKKQYMRKHIAWSSWNSRNINAKICYLYFDTPATSTILLLIAVMPSV